jgi:hypothetical protein
VSDNDDDDEEKTLLRAAGVYMFHSSSSTEHVTKHLLTAPSTPDHLLRNQGKETLPSHWPAAGKRVFVQVEPQFKQISSAPTEKRTSESKTHYGIPGDLSASQA